MKNIDIGKKIVIWEERKDHISQMNGTVIDASESELKVRDTFGNIHVIPISEISILN